MPKETYLDKMEDIKAIKADIRFYEDKVVQLKKELEQLLKDK